MEILSIEIKENDKRYKLADSEKSGCTGCAFFHRYADCPQIRRELICGFASHHMAKNQVWKEIKDE